MYRAVSPENYSGCCPSDFGHERKRRSVPRLGGANVVVRQSTTLIDLPSSVHLVGIFHQNTCNTKFIILSGADGNIVFNPQQSDHGNGLIIAGDKKY